MENPKPAADMPDLTLAAATRPLLGIAKAILPRAKQLHAERSAGENPLAQPLGISPFDKDLDRTIARLGAMHDEGNRAWWSDLMTQFGQMVVQPEPFHVEAVKEWLSLDGVRRDLKAIAKAHIHGSTPAPDAQERLEQAYMLATGEAPNLAKDHIEIAVTVMVAGALALLDQRDRLLLDGQWEIFHNQQAILQKLDSLKVPSSCNPIIEAAAKAELEQIKKHRFVPKVDSRAAIKELLDRIEQGDLQQCSAQVHADILRWAARLHAVHNDTLTEARDFLDRAELRHQGKADDVAIVQAWIRFEQGAQDEAIQSLRPFETPQVRSNKLSMLTGARGNRAALEWVAGLSPSDAPLFSPAGWRNYAHILQVEGQWGDAIAVLEPLGPSDWDECPDIPLLLGLGHVALLLPEPLRYIVLNTNTTLRGKHLIEGQEADQHRTRAIEAFRLARDLLPDPNRIEACDYWLMWLALASPCTRDEAAWQLQAKIADGEDDLQFIDLAQTYDIPLNWREMDRRFRHRALEGGLTDREEAARFHLLRHHAPADQFLDYLNENVVQLGQIIASPDLVGVKLEKLIKAKRLDEAEQLLDANPSLSDRPDIATARMAIADARGQDVSTEALRLYHAAVDRSDGAEVLQTLHNVVTALIGNDRRHDAIPHLRRLFEMERNARNFDMLVEALQQTAGSGAALAELETNSDLLLPDTRYGRTLLERKADALFRLGCFREARVVNDILLEREPKQARLIHRDVVIALRSGDWEHIPAIVDRLFAERGKLDVIVLLHLAHAISDRDGDTEQVMDLLREAAERAPNDANIQLNCYSLACDIGREDEAGAWFQRAIDLSGDGNGPIQSFSLEQVVEMARHHAEARDDKHRRFFSGEIPLHMAAMAFNVPLSRFLISIPRANARQTDGRNTLPIGIRPGSRAPEPPAANAILAMDATTLLLLQDLDLLDMVFGAVGLVKVSPRIMDFLFREIRQLPHHQPSRVERARELLAHVGAGRIKVIECGPVDGRHEAEFGEEIAQLLASAVRRQGRLVALAEIHKAGSLNQELAEWGDAAQLVLSTHQLAEGLRRLGHLDRDLCGAALAHLERVDKAPPPGTDLLSEVPLFIDDLALTYLTDAGILDSLAHRPLSLFVHGDTVARARQLVESDEEGREAIPSLKALRRALAEYYRQGRLAFLPEAPARDEDESDDDKPEHDDRMLMLGDLLHECGSVDAIVIDDRWISRNQHMTDRNGKSVPIKGIVDLLALPAIDGAVRSRALRRLWRGGLAFLPLDPDEVLRDLLDCSPVDAGMPLRVGAELKAIRQSLCRIRSIKMVRLGEEGAWLSQIARACVLVIQRLWNDASVSEARAAILSDWVVDNLMPWHLDWQDSIAEGHWNDIEQLTAQSLAPLAISALSFTAWERKQPFAQWLEGKVIHPLIGTMPRVLDIMAGMLTERLANMAVEIGNGLDN
jgi:tetratricopeptide (TPR) repeat protein